MILRSCADAFRNAKIFVFCGLLILAGGIGGLPVQAQDNPYLACNKLKGCSYACTSPPCENVCITMNCNETREQIRSNAMQCETYPMDKYVRNLEVALNFELKDFRVHIHENPRDTNEVGQHNSSLGTADFQTTIEVENEEFGARDKIWYVNDLNSRETAAACSFEPEKTLKRLDPESGRVWGSVGISCTVLTYFEQSGHEFKGYCRDCLIFPDDQAIDMDYVGATFPVEEYGYIENAHKHPEYERYWDDLERRNESLTARTGLSVSIGTYGPNWRDEDIYQPVLAYEDGRFRPSYETRHLNFFPNGAFLDGKRGKIPESWIFKSFGFILEIEAFNNAVEKLEEATEYALMKMYLPVVTLPEEVLADSVGVHKEREILTVEYLPDMTFANNFSNGGFGDGYPGEIKVCYKSITRQADARLCLKPGPDIGASPERPGAGNTCNDGIDNDNDGVCDWLEPECKSMMTVADNTSIADQRGYSLPSRPLQSSGRVTTDPASPPDYTAITPLDPIAGEKVYPIPLLNGKRIDYCYRWGAQCGKTAADKFCQAKGYKVSESFEVDVDIGETERTWVMGDDRICGEKACDALKNVKCSAHGLDICDRSSFACEQQKPADRAASIGARDQQTIPSQSTAKTPSVADISRAPQSVSPVMPSLPKTTEKAYAKPMANGKRVDLCYKWAEQCGKPAADQFCKSQGFSSAKSYSVEADIGDREPTYVVGSKRVCDQKSCDALKDVICTRQ